MRKIIIILLIILCIISIPVYAETYIANNTVCKTNNKTTEKEKDNKIVAIFLVTASLFVIGGVGVLIYYGRE